MRRQRVCLTVSREPVISSTPTTRLCLHCMLAPTATVSVGVVLTCPLWSTPFLQPLQSMGIITAFDNKAAEFSRISEDPLYVTSVLQSVSAAP